MKCINIYSIPIFADFIMQLFPSQITGPIVLQIQKIRNISAPVAREDSSVAPRMLRIVLNDGVINCTALELEPIQSIRYHITLSNSQSFLQIA